MFHIILMSTLSVFIWKMRAVVLNPFPYDRYCFALTTMPSTRLVYTALFFRKKAIFRVAASWGLGKFLFTETIVFRHWTCYQSKDSRHALHSQSFVSKDYDLGINMSPAVILRWWCLGNFRHYGHKNKDALQNQPGFWFRHLMALLLLSLIFWHFSSTSLRRHFWRSLFFSAGSKRQRALPRSHPRRCGHFSRQSASAYLQMVSVISSADRPLGDVVCSKYKSCSRLWSRFVSSSLFCETVSDSRHAWPICCDLCIWSLVWAPQKRLLTPHPCFRSYACISACNKKQIWP